MNTQELMNAMVAKKEELGIHQMGFTTSDHINMNEEVRHLCEVNYCGHYGKSWVCPPGVGTLEECIAKVMQYKQIFVFTSKHDIEDSFDFEGMMEAKEVHEEICEKVTDYFCSLVEGPTFNMSGEGCSRCAKCAYPDAPCRFPDKASPSPESMGIAVSELAKVVNVNYINGQNTVTYFGCVMFDKE